MGGQCSDVTSKKALIDHVTAMHASQLHLADMQVCQDANAFTSEKKLKEHHRARHYDSWTITNLELC